MAHWDLGIRPGETKTFSHDFAPQLAEGDTLTGTPTVTLTRRGVDRTADFGDPDPQRNGEVVSYELTAPAGSGGMYYVLVGCSTSNGEHLESEIEDAVSGKARPPVLLVSDAGEVEEEGS